MGEASRNSMVSIEVDVTCGVKKPFWYPPNRLVMQEAKTCLSPIRPAAVYVRSGAWYSKHSAFIAIEVQVLVGKSKIHLLLPGSMTFSCYSSPDVFKRIISLITSSSSCVFVLERDRTIRDSLDFIHYLAWGPDAEIDLGSWGVLVAVSLGVGRKVPCLLGEDIGTVKGGIGPLMFVT